MNKLIVTVLAAAFATQIALAQSVAEKNGILTDAAGRTLYTFDKDTPNQSNCSGGCATNWPPFAAAEADKPAAGFSVVTREDGSKQWALNGKPLYFFAADGAPGDVKGDGRGGVWHAARKGSKPASAPRDVQRPSRSY
jgi:predicted lipoprotein with Yx(FWY)xxD motif